MESLCFHFCFYVIMRTIVFRFGSAGDMSDGEEKVEESQKEREREKEKRVK